MTLTDMVPGEKYWGEDGYGWDLVTCLEISQEEIEGHLAGAGAPIEKYDIVKVRYESGEREGEEDIWSQHKDYEAYHICIEPFISY